MGEKALKIITPIERLNVILLNAGNKQLESLARKDESISGNKNLVIEESRLILNDIQNQINKSERQYKIFIKLKPSINLCFKVISEAMLYCTLFNELNINHFF